MKYHERITFRSYSSKPVGPDPFRLYVKAVNRILIIEDDPRIESLLLLHLTEEGYAPEACRNGRDGLERLRQDNYQLLILDLMLPDISGIEICTTLRRTGNQVPILMLTARGDEFDKVLGLELGADDYMTKPFGIRELLARIKALLRRTAVQSDSSAASPAQRRIEMPGLVIDPVGRTASAEGRELDLTTKEFDLLYLFASNPGKAYSREELLRSVWGYEFDGYQHTVNSHINRLRGKIEQDQSVPVYIQTVWGFGYRFNHPAENP